MGRIPSYSKIISGQVPNIPEDAIRAKTLGIDRLHQLVREGEIYGAKIYGSFAFGGANERSDFDILIITKNGADSIRLREYIDEIYKETHFDIEPKTIIDIEEIVNGDHTINETFYHNIEVAPDRGNVVGENPLKIIKSRCLTPLENYKQLLIKKQTTFNQGFYVRTSEDKDKVLQRALEAPVNMGRELLQMMPYFKYPVELEDIGKSAVISKFRELFNQTPLIGAFNYLQDHDQNYTKVLKKALDGSIGQKEYEDYVEYLSGMCIPVAIGWAKEMRSVHRRLLEGNFRMPEGQINPRRGKESLG